MTRYKNTQGFLLIKVAALAFSCGLSLALLHEQVFGVDKLCSAKRQIRNLGDGIKAYYKKKGKYPKSLTALTIPDKKGYTLLTAIPRDPWGNKYIYKKCRTRFDIISLGADGKRGGEGRDDIQYSDFKK